MGKVEGSGGGWLWGRRTLAAGGMGLLLVPAACGAASSEGAGDRPQGNDASAAAASPSMPPQTFKELADNRQGVPVFSDNKGSALKNGEPARIPYDTEVEVQCVAPNNSGITSINALYRVIGGQWNGDYVPANTMDNNAGLGPNPVDLDPRVPACPPGTPGAS